MKILRQGMMKLSIKPALFMITAILGCSMPYGVAAAKEPRQIILTPESSGALIVLKADAWEPAPSMQSAFKLVFSTYADADAKLTSNMFNGNALIEAKKKNFLNGYLIAAIKPGRWVIQSYSQQDKWALCFNASSLQFDVKPGEIIYLGKFDSIFHRRQLTLEATRSGRISISGYGFADFFDLPNGPRFEAIEESEIADLKSTLAHQTPGITAPVHSVMFRPASFGTGSTLFAERKCGGYFNTSANSKKPAG